MSVKRMRGGRLWLPVVLLLAAALRFVAFDLMEFKYDEVTVLTLACGWLEHGGVPQYGIMSGVGVRNPPGFMFFLWPFAACHAAPLTVAAAIAALNVLAVWLAVRVGAALGAPVAGRWTAVFMAVHPWLILYSRKIWAQSLLPPLVLLALWILVRCERQPRSRAVLALPVLVALAVQVHFSAVCLAAVAVLWFACLAVRRRLNGFFATLGVLAGLLLLGPYAAHLVAVRFADAPWAAPATPTLPDWSPWFDPFRMWLRTAFAGGFGYPFAWGPVSLAAVLPGAAGALLQALAVMGTVLVLGLAVCAPWPGRGETAPATAVVPWLWLLTVSPPVFCAARGLPTPPHYFIVGLPPLLLLAGLGVTRLTAPPWCARTAGWGRRGGLAVTLGIAIAVCGAVVWLSVLARLGRDGGTGGDYGPAYCAQRVVAQRLAAAGVTPAALDARGTRDDSLGVRYLMERGAGPAPSGVGRSARLVDVLLNPRAAHDASAEAVGPYRIVWSGPDR